MVSPPPGIGMPGMTADYSQNALEFLKSAGIAGSFDLINTGSNGLVFLGEELTSNPVTQDAAYTAFWRLQPAQRAEWDSLVTVFDGKAPDEARSNAVWRTVVGYAGETYSADPNRPMSVMEIMRQQAQNALDDPRRQRPGAYTGPVTTVSKMRDVNLTNPTEARAFLDDALGNYLGRRPTEDEYLNFTKALNVQERGAPRVVESTTTVTPRGNALREQEGESEERGGFVPQQFAKEYALSQEGAAEEAVAGPLLNAFLNLLRGGRS